MNKSLFGAILVCALVLLAAPAPAAAQTTVTCADCGITSSNVWMWQAIDPSGDGNLTTFDLILLQRVVNYQFGICTFFQEDIAHYWNAQTDFNGDGVWNYKDQNILNAIGDLFYINGNPETIDLCKMINCLRTVILGTCP